jgi:2-C-methyl-D-erythritol 2,4-cyclodiphosphate synthase
MSYRIGIGYDIHRLVEGRKLFLGAVEIPYIKGLLGHSDGDALIHAICDALLGAMGGGDIGQHFPDTDPKYQDISSLKLLEQVYALVKGSNYEINNLDTVILAQEPTISPFRAQMQKRIAEALNLEISKVNIKATTPEGMGEIGKKEAIACWSVVLLSRKEKA